ncbi:hypothetical protein ABZ858_21045 [Streptomyces sp. NPDC047017]|uniref:hypothetical protein n=1 Tax=Streptomyces sp. NPDC047017 TaxID=3155024 RepID=UPI0033D93FCC
MAALHRAVRTGDRSTPRSPPVRQVPAVCALAELHRIEDTQLMRQVHTRIEEFREDTVTRPPQSFPH